MIRAAGLVLALSAVLLAIPFVFGTEAQGGPSLSLSPKFVRSGNTFVVTVVDGSRTGSDDSPDFPLTVRAIRIPTEVRIGRREPEHRYKSGR